MKLVFVVTVAALCLAGASASWINNDTLRQISDDRHPVLPKVVTVNLDLPPKERWVNIAKDFKDQAWKIKWYVTQFVPKWAYPFVEKIAGNIKPYFHDYGEEMIGLAEGLGVEVGDIVIVNLVYQLESLGLNCSNWNNTGPTGECKGEVDKDGPGACTSIVTEDAQGQMIHARNLDWNLEDTLLDFVITANYQKNNKTIFTGSQVLGEVGVLNGMRHGSFSASMNARGKGGNIFLNVLEALTHGDSSRTPTHNLRYALENGVDFKDGLTKLSEKPLVDEVYYIVAGAKEGEGAIMSRARSKAEDTWMLDGTADKASVTNNTQKDWYKLQTNYDHWKYVPYADNRRDPGNAMMDRLGKNGVTLSSMYNVVTTWPVYNFHTDLTALMVPSNNTYQAWVWRK